MNRSRVVEFGHMENCVVLLCLALLSLQYSAFFLYLLLITTKDAWILFLLNRICESAEVQFVYIAVYFVKLQWSPEPYVYPYASEKMFLNI